jgi:hypothetical protein
LEEECLTAGDGSEPVAQLVDLGCDHEWRHPGEGQRNLAQPHLVRPLRLLRGGQLTPRVQPELIGDDGIRSDGHLAKGSCRGDTILR